MKPWLSKLVLIIGLLYDFGLLAQTDVKGVVLNAKKEPIPFANVVVLESEASTRALVFGFSDENGIFALKISQKSNKYAIKVSCFGYKALLQTIAVVPNEKITLVLEEQITTLNEVVVTAENKSLKDTLAIKTKHLNLTESSSLRDILDKTDGFMVTKEGGISYQGVPIVKVLINKKEVFVNQNKVALDNLTYDMMNNLQLINNYKDKFKIGFDNFTTPVININTKKEFKGVLKKKTELLLGYKNSYDAKAKLMFFSDNFNAFLLNHTNNVGAKTFSYDDITNASLLNTSGFFKENLSSYFVEEDLLKRNFNSNTSLTVRKQGNSYKAGVLLVLNYLESIKNNQNTTWFVNSEKIAKQETNTFEDFGRFLSAKYYFNKLLGKRHLLDYTAEVGNFRKTKQETNEISNYTPTTDTITENNQTTPNSTYIDHALVYTGLLSEKMLLSLKTNYATERASNGFESVFIENRIGGLLHQRYVFNHSLWAFQAGIERKFSDLFSMETGCKSYFFTHEFSKNNLDFLQRRGVNHQFFVQTRGKNAHTEYSVLIAPDFYFFDANTVTTQPAPRVSASFDYKWNANRSIVATYEQANSLNDFYKNIDTLALSFNNRVLGNNTLKYNLTTNQKATLGYYFSSMAQSQSLSITYSLGLVHHSLETIFDKVINNVFYYKNYAVSPKQTTTLAVGANKGYYFGDKLHKVDFYANASFGNTSFPSIFNNITQQYQKTDFQYNCQVSVAPKKNFLTGISLAYFSTVQQYYTNAELANSYRSQAVFLNVSAKQDKLEAKCSFAKTFNQSSGFSFNTPMLDISLSYKLNDNIALSLKGKSLISLFGLSSNNFSDIHQFSDGVVLQQNLNLYRINYLVCGASFNF